MCLWLVVPVFTVFGIEEIENMHYISIEFYIAKLFLLKVRFENLYSLLDWAKRPRKSLAVALNRYEKQEKEK